MSQCRGRDPGGTWLLTSCHNWPFMPRTSDKCFKNKILQTKIFKYLFNVKALSTWIKGSRINISSRRTSSLRFRTPQSLSWTKLIVCHPRPRCFSSFYSAFLGVRFNPPPGAKAGTVVSGVVSHSRGLPALKSHCPAKHLGPVTTTVTDNRKGMTLVLMA